MPIKIEAYKCQFCNRVSRTLSGIKLHEQSCKVNPSKNNCQNCVHAYLRGEEYCDGAVIFCTPWCAYHDREIFGKDKRDAAYFVDCEIDDMEYELGCVHEWPLPYTCWHFASKGKHGFAEEPEWQEKYAQESGRLKREDEGNG